MASNGISAFKSAPQKTIHGAAMAAAQLLLMNDCLEDLDAALAFFAAMAEESEDGPES